MKMNNEELGVKRGASDSGAPTRVLVGFLPWVISRPPMTAKFDVFHHETFHLVDRNVVMKHVIVLLNIV